MPSASNVLDLLQPSVRMHAPGADVFADFATDAYYLKDGDRRGLLATHAEIVDGTYKGKVLDRIKAFAGDTFR